MVTKTIFVHVDRLSRTPRPKIFFFLPAGTADLAGTAAGGENSFSSGVESASRKSSWGILFAVGWIITAGRARFIQHKTFRSNIASDLRKSGQADFFLGKAGSYRIRHAPKRSVYPLSPKIQVGAAVLAAIASSANANPFPASGPTVPGTHARLRFGQAAAPEGAPLAVKRAIWAANQLHRKPYVFGGGHKSFADRG